MGNTSRANQKNFGYQEKSTKILSLAFSVGIYTFEKRRQKELPLRIARRNKEAAKKHQAEVDSNKRAWESFYHDNEVDEMFVA